MENRFCKKCGIEKQITDFPKRSGKSAHLHNHTCKECWSAKMRQWRSANPEKVKATRALWIEKNPGRIEYLHRKNSLKKRYGLSVFDWDELFAAQDGACKICKTKDQKLVVDHCHSSGKVRMLLCNKCNRGLGCFNDDPELIARAAEVIKAIM